MVWSVAKLMITFLVPLYLFILPAGWVPDAQQILTGTNQEQGTLIPAFTLQNVLTLSNLFITPVQALQALWDERTPEVCTPLTGSEHPIL